MTKFFDAILGRSKPVPARLDALFGLPSAAITLQTEAGLVPTGQAGVCFKPVADASFADVQGDITKLMAMQAAGPGSAASELTRALQEITE